MSENAIPINKASFMKVFEDATKAANTPTEDKDALALKELSMMPGWAVLKKHLDARVHALEGSGEYPPTMSVEEIGFKHLISRSNIETIKAIISFVEQTAQLTEVTP